MKSEDNKENKETEIRPYNYTQLALLYGVSHQTMTKWIKMFEHELGERTTKIFTKRQVEIIFNKLGRP